MLRRTFLLALAGAALSAAPAHAATVAAERPVARTCADSLLPAGTAGATRTAFTPRRTGVFRARLRAASGDWDLAVFDRASGRLLGAAAGFGARELVTGAATPRRTLVLQGCRRSGSAGSARVDFELTPVARATGPRELIQIVRVPLAGNAELERLEALGLDVTHNRGDGFADVALYSAAERSRLAGAGFTWTVRVPDLAAVDRARPPATRAQARALPSGNTDYRTLAEYQADLKAIVDANPGLARPIVIGESLEGRPIEGVELATDVDRADDGRPTFVVMGLHHAREWPSGEMPMEFAVDLAAGYGSDPRIKALLDRVRVVALPVINPDGFNVSRSAGATPFDDDSLITLPLIVSDGLAYKRKNCRAVDPAQQEAPCETRPAAQGVDLNRNYGAYWGGVGSSTNPAAQNYRGTAPYSEPESEAVRRLSSTRNIVTLVTHHTFTEQGVWLRQPGFCMWGAAGCTEEEDVVPDEAGMRQLGDAMAQATGWDSALGWAIGEITGATEDWNYFAAAAYGYTPEQRGPNFHPAFADAVVAEYDGTAPGAQGGVREALLRATEQAGDRAFHSVIAGTAPAGSVLRLKKSFVTDTSLPDVKLDDTLDLTIEVPASGEYEWDVNPSTRPLVAAPEAYTMTCEVGGIVRATREVIVARGETATADFACDGSDPQPTPTATATATPTPTPTATPGPAGKPALRITRDRFRARTINRARRISVLLRTRGGALRRVVARLTRGNRTYARGRVATASGRKRLRLRRVRRVRPGRHVIRVRARDAQNRVVTAAKRVRVTR